MPSGSKLQGGTLTTKLAVTGTTDAPVITGPVRIDNTQLAGFDLASKMGPAAALVGAKPGSGTTIQILSLNLREAGGGLEAQNILLTVAGLGTATGSGTVSAAKALNFHVIAKLAQTGATGMATTAISMIGGGVGGAAAGALKNGIPVTITGTASSPVITPDMKGLTGKGLSPGSLNAGSLLGKGGPADSQQEPGQGAGRIAGETLIHRKCIRAEVSSRHFRFAAAT